MSQHARIAVYTALSGALFVSTFLLGDHRWIAFVGIGLLLLVAALERCELCGGTLMIFGVKRMPDTGQLGCRECWRRGPGRPGGPADPVPPRVEK